MDPEDVLRAIEKIAPLQGLPIVGPAKGAILDEVVAAHRPSRVLEVGTLVGYSAIRIGRLLPPGGRVTCVELSPRHIAVASENIRRAGLDGRIEILQGDALSVLPRLRGPVDMAFIDADKSQYLAYLKAFERRLHLGSVVVADNVIVFADEVADYLDHVRNSGMYESVCREAPLALDPSETDGLEISVRK